MAKGTAHNEITGQSIETRAGSAQEQEKFREGYSKIDWGVRLVDEEDKVEEGEGNG